MTLMGGIILKRDNQVRMGSSTLNVSGIVKLLRASEFHICFFFKILPACRAKDQRFICDWLVGEGQGNCNDWCCRMEVAETVGKADKKQT